MTTTILISKVEEKPSTFGICNFKPAKHAQVHHTEVGKCLYVEGTDELGNTVHFWTPQAIIVKTTGMLNYELIRKNTGNFFKEIKGEMVGHKSPFEGDIIMPVVIECKDKIIPAINVGQTINVEFKSEESKFGSRRLKIVRLVED